jgi:stress-induced morphogen
MSRILQHSTQNFSLPPAYLIVLVTDLIPAGCGQNLIVTVASPEFAKLRTLQRHKLVNEHLKKEVAAVHAWSLKCYTPEQIEKLGLQ